MSYGLQAVIAGEEVLNAAVRVGEAPVEPGKVMRPAPRPGGSLGGPVSKQVKRSTCGRVQRLYAGMGGEDPVVAVAQQMRQVGW